MLENVSTFAADLGTTSAAQESDRMKGSADVHAVTVARLKPRNARMKFTPSPEVMMS